MQLELNTGLYLRLDVLGGNTVRVRLGDGKEWSESGLNRYGILDETRLGKNSGTSVRGNTISLKGGFKLKVAADGTFQVTVNGKPVTRMASIERRAKGGFRIAFDLQEKERLYGLGDENRSMLQKRGHRAEMVIRNVTGYIPIPYLMSTLGWAVMLNTTCYHVVDAGATNPDELVFECAHGDADFYLFLGDGMPELLNHYTCLSGRPALLPRWGYGFTFVCDEREVRARDVLYEAYEFRRQGIPCDVIGLEPDWMETHYDSSVDKKWSETRFHIPFWLEPNGDGTFAGTLHKMGFHLSLWLCCDYDLSEYEEYLVKQKNGELQGNEPGELVDVDGKMERSPDDLVQDEHFENAVRIDKITKHGEPWFKHLCKFVDDGADAFKLDGAYQVLFHPDRRWYNGMQDYEMHNLYPVIYNKQMTNGFVEHTGRRPMVYSAGGYAGIQQYSATWTGDTGGGAKPLCGLLNLAMSGHSNGTCDLQIWDKAGIHSGMLMPWSQLLGWHMYSEPWFQGEEISECFKFYSKLRYRLLPYIYSTAWQAHCTGMPMMRPLALAYPEDENVADIVNEYMFGESLLVASFTSKVYLPKGTWYNYWTGKQFKGGKWYEVGNYGEWGDGTQPVGGALFVKGGAIIPTAPDMLFSTEKPLDKIIWQVYADKGESSFIHFDDDGTTFAFEAGKYEATKVTGIFRGRKLRLIVENVHDGAPELVAGREHVFDIHGLPEGTEVVYE